jgi:hypothetical protein
MTTTRKNICQPADWWAGIRITGHHDGLHAV